MASHRLKSLYAIKECSTCGRLYTRECCSIGSLKDKILVPEPDSSPRCARCGTPVDDFQDTSESFDDNTKVVNALREPSVVNQDLGIKSSQEPPQIDHNCCYECGGDFIRWISLSPLAFACFVGKILPNENSFNYDSKPHSFNVSPSVLTYPPQLQFETYLCELCGNNAHYVMLCSPQFLFEVKFEKKGGKLSKKKSIIAVCRFMAFGYCDDEDDYIPLGDIIARNSTFKAIIPDLSIEEPNDSLNMGDEHLTLVRHGKRTKVIKV
ncbi:hypothetical protein Tco_0401619 [Tanacetum coccineum]